MKYGSQSIIFLFVENFNFEKVLKEPVIFRAIIIYLPLCLYVIGSVSTIILWIVSIKKYPDASSISLVRKTLN